MKGEMAGKRADPPPPHVGSRLGSTGPCLNRRQGPVNLQPPSDLGETGAHGCLPRCRDCSEGPDGGKSIWNELP